MKKRLSWNERHKQLIAVAMELVREESADALTLIKVANRAGVTKPIAYDHFKSKEGLLTELCRTFDEAQREDLKALIGKDDIGLAQLSRAVAESYMRCYAETEGEWHALFSSIRSNALTVEVYRELFEEHIALLIALFGPKTSLSPAELRNNCIGLMGAGETISISMTRGEMTHKAATNTLAMMFHASMSAKQSEIV
jgi:AcrR family transcriptional regulator